MAQVWSGSDPRAGGNGYALRVVTFYSSQLNKLLDIVNSTFLFSTFGSERRILLGSDFVTDVA